jgi:hypothetical protein
MKYTECVAQRDRNCIVWCEFGSNKDEMSARGSCLKSLPSDAKDPVSDLTVLYTLFASWAPEMSN